MDSRLQTSGMTALPSLPLPAVTPTTLSLCPPPSVIPAKAGIQRLFFSADERPLRKSNGGSLTLHIRQADHLLLDSRSPITAVGDMFRGNDVFWSLVSETSDRDFRVFSSNSPRRKTTPQSMPFSFFSRCIFLIIFSRTLQIQHVRYDHFVESIGISGINAHLPLLQNAAISYLFCNFYAFLLES